MFSRLYPESYHLSKRDNFSELLLSLKDVAKTRRAPAEGWVVCGLHSVTVNIVFTTCVVHCSVKAFRRFGKCNFSVMGRAEDEGGELGRDTNPQSRDAEKREFVVFSTLMEKLLA